MVKIGDRVQIDEAVSNYYGRCGIVTYDHVCMTYPYRVKFDDGDDCIFKGKYLIVLSTEKFKVGDKVKILNTEFGNIGKIGTITNISGSVMIYFVEIEGDCGHVCQWSDASDLELVEEETSMKFKVGDRVQVVDIGSAFYGDKGTVVENDGTDNLPIHVSFDVDEHVCWFYEYNLKALHEEEKVMKFKVGDKVKVSNSWDGHNGEIGEINEYNKGYEFEYFVTFDGKYEESFREEDLELVKGKQSFTKSDLKTGMGVVLRDGSKGHVLIGTPTQDTIRFIGKNEWIGLDDYADDLTVKRFKNLDIIAVYKTKFENQYMTDRVFEQDLLYERKEEPTKMTMKEINEHFGKAIEIVE